jgi:hypothetical protein
MSIYDVLKISVQIILVLSMSFNINELGVQEKFKSESQAIRPWVKKKNMKYMTNGAQKYSQLHLATCIEPIISTPFKVTDCKTQRFLY